MTPGISRRNFVLSTAIASAAALVPGSSLADPAATADESSSPVRLGLASYTFRNFAREQMIGFMKDLRVFDLNAKDAKDHLPMDAAAEAQAVSDYTANGIRLHAAGALRTSAVIFTGSSGVSSRRCSVTDRALASQPRTRRRRSSVLSAISFTSRRASSGGAP